MCTSILRIFDTSLAVVSKKLAAMAVCSGRLLPFLLAIQGGAEEANHWVGKKIPEMSFEEHDTLRYS